MAPGRRARAALATAFAAALLLIEAAPSVRHGFAGNEYAVFAIPAPSAAVHANGRLEEAVLAWINRQRADRGLPLLQPNRMMRDAARAYGLDMFAHGYLSHVSRGGRTLQDRLAGLGLSFGIVGENLAYAPDIEEAEQALWQSQPHRRNMLYAAFRVIGIGVIDGGDGVIVVQDFADEPSRDSTAARRAGGSAAR